MSDDGVGAIISAGAINMGATGTNAVSIAGGVIGGLLGVAVVDFFVLVSLFSLFIHFHCLNLW